VEGLVVSASKDIVTGNIDTGCIPLDPNSVFGDNNITPLKSTDVSFVTSLYPRSDFHTEEYLNEQNAWAFRPWGDRSGTNLTYSAFEMGVNNRSGYIFDRIPWHSQLYNLNLEITNKKIDEIVYTCRCPNVGSSTTCLYTDVVPPIRKYKDGTNTELPIWKGRNFYVTALDNSNEDWWQVVNGNVYSGSGISMKVPRNSDLQGNDGDGDYTSCTDETGCVARIAKAINKEDFLTNLPGNAQSGIPISMTGTSINATNVDGDEFLAHRVDKNTYFSGVGVNGLIKEDFSYFKKLFEDSHNKLLDNSCIDGESCNNETDCLIYYESDSINIDLSDNDDIIKYQLNAGEKKIFFIDGDLTIEDKDVNNGNLLEVGQNEFLAFIISGSLTIDSSVGYNNQQTNSGSKPYFKNFGENTPEGIWNPFDSVIDVNSNSILDKVDEVNLAGNVQGIFVANNIIIDDSNLTPRKFIGEGSFISFNNVYLNRSFSGKKLLVDDIEILGNTINALHAPVSFKYRPDFVKNTPKWMKHTKKVYQEFN
jgi:hypothetical protein